MSTPNKQITHNKFKEFISIAEGKIQETPLHVSRVPIVIVPKDPYLIEANAIDKKLLFYKSKGKEKADDVVQELRKFHLKLPNRIYLRDQDLLIKERAVIRLKDYPTSHSNFYGTSTLQNTSLSSNPNPATNDDNTELISPKSINKTYAKNNGIVINGSEIRTPKPKRKIIKFKPLVNLSHIGAEIMSNRSSSNGAEEKKEMKIRVKSTLNRDLNKKKTVSLSSKEGNDLVMASRKSVHVRKTSLYRIKQSEQTQYEMTIKPKIIKKLLDTIQFNKSKQETLNLSLTSTKRYIFDADTCKPVTHNEQLNSTLQSPIKKHKLISINSPSSITSPRISPSFLRKTSSLRTSPMPAIRKKSDKLGDPYFKFCNSCNKRNEDYINLQNNLE